MVVGIDAHLPGPDSEVNGPPAYLSRWRFEHQARSTRANTYDPKGIRGALGPDAFRTSCTGGVRDDQGRTERAYRAGCQAGATSRW
jgi:hypothetical protein